ncbi:MAG: class I SAM-dependent methyltransferase [Candidatus Thermoplasmatota archaeon]|nr:class I SAM-dependent methyltransferase [Candidatus Thermoplasmatota archaeon]
MDAGDIASNPMVRNALGDSFPASPEVTLRLCREAGVDEYSHVLHLGAGVGTVCQMITDAFGCQTTGVVLIEQLLQHCTSNDERVKYVHGPMTSPIFEPNSFTHVLIECRCIAQKDLPSVFASVRTVLTTDGQLIVNEPVIGGNSNLPKVIGRIVGETKINQIIQQRTAMEIGIEISTAGFDMIHNQEEKEVTDRILMKLNQASMMLKMAMRFSSFDPYSEEFPFTKKDLLKAFDELKRGLDDETFSWHSWRSSPN